MSAARLAPRSEAAGVEARPTSAGRGPDARPTALPPRATARGVALASRAAVRLVALALLLTSGCPPASPPPASPASPTAGDPGPSAPIASAGAARAPTPSAVASSGPATSAARPVRVTVRPPAPPAVGDLVRLGSGDLLALDPTLRVGSRGVDGGRARLDVLIGAFCYAVEAAPGERVAAGSGALLVEGLEGEVALVRWERAPSPDEPLELEPRRDGDRLLLREQALFKLEDGARVGVGEVREAPGGLRVALTIFPPGYQLDPGKGYARTRAVEGQVVGPADGPRLRVRAITRPSGDRRAGTVELARVAE